MVSNIYAAPYLNVRACLMTDRAAHMSTRCLPSARRCSKWSPAGDVARWCTIADDRCDRTTIAVRSSINRGHRCCSPGWPLRCRGRRADEQRFSCNDHDNETSCSQSACANARCVRLQANWQADSSSRHRSVNGSGHESRHHRASILLGWSRTFEKRQLTNELPLLGLRQA